jgi:hypothetical protein
MVACFIRDTLLRNFNAARNVFCYYQKYLYFAYKKRNCLCNYVILKRKLSIVRNVVNQGIFVKILI